MMFSSNYMIVLDIAPVLNKNLPATHSWCVPKEGNGTTTKAWPMLAVQFIKEKCEWSDIQGRFASPTSDTLMPLYGGNCEESPSCHHAIPSPNANLLECLGMYVSKISKLLCQHKRLCLGRQCSITSNLLPALAGEWPKLMHGNEHF
jgi:hypothetical protein